MNTSKRPTIYSIGYSGLKPDDIAEIAEGLRALVIDVRGNPVSRQRGFGRLQLQGLLGDRYQWLGGSGLGNRPPKQEVTAAGIASIAKFNRPIILMCQCFVPAECHRHTLIARPLLRKGIDVRHIFNGCIIRASDLDNESISEENLPYDDLAEVMARGGYDGAQVEPTEPAEPERKAGASDPAPPSEAENEPPSDIAKSSQPAAGNVIAKRRIKPDYLF